MTPVQDDDPEALDARGVALAQAGRHGEAEACFRRALRQRPAAAATHGNLGNVLTATGRPQEAVAAYRTALRLAPQLAKARFGLALALADLGQREEAEQQLQQVIGQAPGFAEAHGALAVLQSQRQAWQQAEAALRRALALDPGMADAHFNLAMVLVNQLRLPEAGQALREAVRLDPSNAMYRASLVVETLPEVARTPEEAAGATAAFARALQGYADWRASCTGPGAVTDHRLKRPPFLLAYREGNHRALLSRFADEVGPPPAFTKAPRPPRRERLRLGVVSAHLRRHSVWDVITKGLLAQLDRGRFELCLYHLGSLEDGETAQARALCDHWRDARSAHGAPQSASQWAAAIAQDRCDVLFYPAIGMDAMTWLLARERLAPVQAVGWGHPITSGFATMDLFCSGELLEPPQDEAQTHYRERLVRLPGTGACTIPMVLPDEDLPAALQDELGSRPGPRLLVPQMPFKFDPRFDALLARIVEAVDRCTVLVPRHPDCGPAYEVLAARLGAALRARGRDPDAVLKFVPWMRQPQFNALLDAADVVLDCTAFSGYTTAWLAAQRGAPMVTLEGAFLRQRLAAGLLRRIGITGTVVHTEDDYVRIATELALDGRHSRRGQARRRALQSAAPAVDGDVSVVRAFEQVLLQAAAERR